MHLQDFDVIVIGGGPAGLAAGLYATRARARTLLLEKAFVGGQAATTHLVENYPGFPEGIAGPDLTDRMATQAKRLGLTVVSAEVDGITPEGGRLVVRAPGAEYLARAAVVATGAAPKELGVPGELELRGRGVSYCATCDGAFFRDKHVHVVGGGDSAVVEALFLTRFAERVTIVHRRSELRATKVLQEEAFAHPKVDFVWEATLSGIEGQEHVESVVVRLADGDSRVLPSDGVFIYVGNVPNTGFLADLLPLDERGYVVTDRKMRTVVPGLFAAGDCRAKGVRQIVTAVSDGATAAVEAIEYLDRPEWGTRE